jgi:hypothetical protein
VLAHHGQHLGVILHNQDLRSLFEHGPPARKSRTNNRLHQWKTDNRQLTAGQRRPSVLSA